MSETRTAEVTALPARGMVTVKGDPADEGFVATVREVAGIDPPGPRAIVYEGDTALAWMAPDEFLLMLPDGAAQETADRLEAGFGNVHAMAADVSDARARFRISGSGAREVLAKGAPVDLSREAFAPGEIRRTRLGQVACAFWMTDAESFELVCFRSVAEYVETWLRLASEPGTLPGVL